MIFKNTKLDLSLSSHIFSFLDKVYAMSNEVYLQMFLKNPREYLKFPLPQSPCKICIIGASLTGKTTLATLLAKKYNGKVRNNLNIFFIEY